MARRGTGRAARAEGFFGSEKWAPRSRNPVSVACRPQTFFSPITQTICLLCSNYKTFEPRGERAERHCNDGDICNNLS